MYYVYGLQLYVRSCIVHTAGTYTGARIMYLRQRYTVFWRFAEHTHTNVFFSHVAIRNSLRSNKINVITLKIIQSGVVYLVDILERKTE